MPIDPATGQWTDVEPQAPQAPPSSGGYSPQSAMDSVALGQYLSQVDPRFTRRGGMAPQTTPNPGIKIGHHQIVSGHTMDTLLPYLAAMTQTLGAPSNEPYSNRGAAIFNVAKGLMGGYIGSQQTRIANNKLAEKNALELQKERATQVGEFARGMAQHRWRLQEQAARPLGGAAGDAMVDIPGVGKVRATSRLGREFLVTSGVVQQARPLGVSKVDPTVAARVHRIVLGIKRGDLSPDPNDYGRDSSLRLALADEMENQGLNQKELSNNYLSEKTFLRSANGSVALRLSRNVVNARNSIPYAGNLLDDAENKITARGDVKELNSVVNGAAMRGAYGPEAATAASKLRAQLRGLSLELSNIYQGGTAPTDNTIKKLMDVLDSDWSAADLHAALEVAQRDLGFRVQAMKEVGPIGLKNGKATNVPEADDSTSTHPKAANAAGRAFLDAGTKRKPR